MSRFDLHEVRDTSAGYLLDVQADGLERLDTRVVIPLLPAAASTLPARQLNPVFTVNRSSYILQTQWITSVRRGRLGRPVGNLTEYWAEIARALDLLFTGF